MSASLVGSEMCIRDRGGLLLDPHAARHGRHGRAPAGRDLGQLPDRGHPVSYTHLTLPTICSV
eukprot:4830165-Alexandrium_andersonii.AAC.1